MNLLLAAAAAAAAAAGNAPPPHVVLMLVDELGTGDVPWTDPELYAPTIQALGEGGLLLTHQYAWHWCAPTRGALMSGRYPMHSGYEYGANIPSGSQPGMPGHGGGLDLRLPLLPAELKRASFATHMLGKWHLGYRKRSNLPTQRGFDSYLGLLGGGSDHFQKTLCVPGSTNHGLNGLCPCEAQPQPQPQNQPYRVDYWDGEAPAHALWDNETYDSYQFAARAVQLVQEHTNLTQPFFLYWATHKSHGPLQAVPEFLQHYPVAPGYPCGSLPAECTKRGWGGCGCSQMCYCNRRIFRAMVTAVDAMLHNLTEAMKAQGLWDNTLLFFLGDNGGPNSAGAHNSMFKGMKFSHWEGGHRVPSFIAGPALPPALRSQRYNHPVHLVDLHATILDLAGLTPLDVHGVLPADGVSLLPLLNLTTPLTTPVRSELWIANDVLRVGDFKLITGAGTQSTTCMLGLGGNPVGRPDDPRNLSNYCGRSSCTGKEVGADALICSGCRCSSYSPTYTANSDAAAAAAAAGVGAAAAAGGGGGVGGGACTPCIFDVRNDPSEKVNLAASLHPINVARLANMTARLRELQQSSYSPEYPADNLTAACDAMVQNGGFFGPWAS